MTAKQRKEIVDLLCTAYNMELETVANYIANSIHLDGIRAKHIKDSLAADVAEELTHAQTLARRIKVLDGRVPGSMALKMTQKSMQPPANPLNVKAVIKGVIAAEKGAVDHYQQIIEACDGIDPVTQDICTTLKGDEEEHLQLFKGFLSEAESMKI